MSVTMDHSMELIMHNLVQHSQRIISSESKLNTEIEAKLTYFGQNFDSHLRRFEGAEWHRVHVPGYTENVIPYLMAHGLSYDQAKHQANRPYYQSWKRVYDDVTCEVRLGVLQCNTDRGRRVNVYDTNEHGWAEMCPAGSILYACNISEKEFGRRSLRRMTRWEGRCLELNTCLWNKNRNHTNNTTTITSTTTTANENSSFLFGKGRRSQCTSTIAPKGGTELTERFLHYLPHICPNEEVMFVKRTYVDILGKQTKCNEVFRRVREIGTLVSPLDRILVGDDVLFIRTMLIPKGNDSSDFNSSLQYTLSIDGSVEGSPITRGILALVTAFLCDNDAIARCFGYDNLPQKCIIPTAYDILQIDPSDDDFTLSLELNQTPGAKLIVIGILEIVQEHIRDLLNITTC